MRLPFRLVALFLAVGSHASFLAVLRRIANEEMGLEIEPLFWSTLGLGLVTCLLFGMACLGWVSVFGTLGLFSLSGFYLVWNGCYLAILWQVGSRA